MIEIFPVKLFMTKIFKQNFDVNFCVVLFLKSSHALSTKSRSMKHLFWPEQCLPKSWAFFRLQIFIAFTGNKTN